jgi:hypothetical protein
MDLTPYVAELEESLAAAAAAGDDQTRRTAAALAAALQPAARLSIMNALADLALEVTDVLGDRTVELRLEGGDVNVAVSTPAVEDEAPESPPPLAPGGESARITLRLPEELKDQAERAATAGAVSLNTWLTRAVQSALQAGPAASPRRQNERGHRVRGWVQG